MGPEDEYIILTPLDVEYTAKWYLELFANTKSNYQSECQKEYSLLNLEDFEDKLQIENLTPEEIVSKLNGYKSKIRICKDAGEDVAFDLFTYDLKRKLEVTSPKFFNTILEWEKSVRVKAPECGVKLLPRVEIFVKVFTFIKLGYTTRHKELADTFSMPLNLYIEFDKLYDPAQIKL